MSPGAEDVSPSPEPGNDQDTSGIMAEEKLERASTEEKSPAHGSGSESKPAAKSNAKDPNRPRRKKARRACFACQRAHLTCGDERPCLRCIKRGLQDQCHDGVRKKAKYLHDAPPEALVPGFAGHYQVNGAQSVPNVPNAQLGPNGVPISQPGNYMAQASSSTFPQYTAVNQPNHMAPPMTDTADPMLAAFSNQHNVDTPGQYQSGSSQQVSPVQTMAGNLDQSTSIDNTTNPSYDDFLNMNDPSLFNFDISGLNFGNHYGALEFGMLGHMSSGAVGTPDVEAMNQLGGQSQHNGLAFDNTSGFNPANNFNFNQYSGWQGVPNTGSRQNSNSLWTGQSAGMDAFAIGEPSLTGQSPHSQDLNYNAAYQAGNLSPDNQFAHLDHSSNQQDLLRQSFSQTSPQRKQIPPYSDPATQRKRRRDTSEIYTSVTAPYQYTVGFHALTAFLQKRFNSKKTLRIAKALASIRPSFISCNKNLNNDDLIFMEKCFQRTLCEYEDFVNHYGTPTIICRRTGEIAAVSKEFSLVTGWRRDVLLGKESNLNVNTGGNNASGTQTGSSSRGAVTPRMPSVEVNPGRPQPVFLAELMDEDSVVQFYEDFAELAFGASRTSIIGQRCSLLKYKTKDDLGWNEFSEEGVRNKRTATGEIKAEPNIIKGEAGTNTLGDRDGRVECSMCWTVKRDVFDIPMLIVMNFLPIIC